MKTWGKEGSQRGASEKLKLVYTLIPTLDWNREKINFCGLNHSECYSIMAALES